MPKKAAGNSKGSSKHSRSKSNAGNAGTSTAAHARPSAPSSGRSNVNANANAENSNGSNTAATAGQRSQTTSSPSGANTSTAAGIPLKFRLMFLLFPLLQMLWQIEAPIRPFSAVRDPATGEIQRRLRQPVTGTGTDGKEQGQEKGGEEEELLVIEPRMLVVIPHVRDLAFFAPTVGVMLEGKRRETSTLFVVGLSGGDGGEDSSAGASTSTSEWNNALDVFGLEQGRRWLLDVPELQDDPSAIWDPDVVSDTVLRYVIENDIDTILTFDERGITANPQHAAVSQGVNSLLRSPQLNSTLSAAAAAAATSSSTKSTKSSAPESKSESERIYPRAFLLQTPSPFLNLGPLSPIVQHCVLLYRALTSSTSLKPSSTSMMTRERRTTTFVSDVRMYYKSWKALTKIGSEVSLGSVVWWVVGRNLWVNEWVEI